MTCGQVADLVDIDNGIHVDAEVGLLVLSAFEARALAEALWDAADLVEAT